MASEPAPSTESAIKETLTFPPEDREFLLPYLPPHSTYASSQSTNLSHTGIPSQDASSSDPSSEKATKKPFITLTYATSLDSSLSIAPLTRTALSGPATKAMTHFLRSQHDAILIGVGTAITDDPALNCRIGDDPALGIDTSSTSHQPRPVVVDPKGRWEWSRESKVIEAAREGRGKGPWVLVARGPVSKGKVDALGECGGEVLFHALVGDTKVTPWRDIFAALAEKGIRSVMVEGGGKVVNGLLTEENVGLVDSVVVTVAPVYLGKNGVKVEMDSRRKGDNWAPAVDFKDVVWKPLGRDVVMCGKIQE